MKKDAIHASWFDVLQEEFDKPYFPAIAETIKRDIMAGRTVYPKGEEIFRAFNVTPFDKVKVVILGQDPYHGYGQAHGLAFSVPQHVPIPPSLRNIFAEIERDIRIDKKKAQGDLTAWGEQGVLLLNTSLTVLAGQPMSHSTIGWQLFTDEVIRKISHNLSHIVFLLWGKFAMDKRHLVDEHRHLVLTAPHPSPLSARRGFLGCGHFSKANEYLNLHQQSSILW